MFSPNYEALRAVFGDHQHVECDHYTAYFDRRNALHTITSTREDGNCYTVHLTSPQREQFTWKSRADSHADAITRTLRASPYRPWTTYNPRRPGELANAFLLDLDDGETVSSYYKLEHHITVLDLPTFREYQETGPSDALKAILEGAGIVYPPQAGDDTYPTGLAMAAPNSLTRTSRLDGTVPHIASREGTLWHADDWGTRITAALAGRAGNVTATTPNPGVTAITVTEAGTMTFTDDYEVMIEGIGADWGLKGHPHGPVHRVETLAGFTAPYSPYAGVTFTSYPGGIMPRN